MGFIVDLDDLRGAASGKRAVPSKNMTPVIASAPEIISNLQTRFDVKRSESNILPFERLLKQENVGFLKLEKCQP